MAGVRSKPLGATAGYSLPGPFCWHGDNQPTNQPTSLGWQLQPMIQSRSQNDCVLLVSWVSSPCVVSACDLVALANSNQTPVDEHS